jgi:hypothetical protein
MHKTAEIILTTRLCANFTERAEKIDPTIERKTRIIKKISAPEPKTSIPLDTISR